MNQIPLSRVFCISWWPLGILNLKFKKIQNGQKTHTIKVLSLTFYSYSKPMWGLPVKGTAPIPEKGRAYRLSPRLWRLVLRHIKSRRQSRDFFSSFWLLTYWLSTSFEPQMTLFLQILLRSADLYLFISWSQCWIVFYGTAVAKNKDLRCPTSLSILVCFILS